MVKRDLVTFARIAADTYNPRHLSDLLGDWMVQDMIEDDNFLARAYKPAQGKGGLVVAFRGSANWKDGVVADCGAIGLSLNALALKLNSAIDFTGKIKTLYGDCWLVGHSLGGAYVQMLAAIADLPGTTFNAPGVLSLLNQMSPHLAVRLAGAIGGGALSVTTLHLVDYFNKAAAAMGDAGFQAVLNYRGNMDPVSLVGTHVGMPVQTIKLRDQSPHPHSMAPIIRTLELR
jgi:hypothetical protein